MAIFRQNELRLALRRITRDRTTTILLISSLSLAIGVNGAMLRIVDALLFRPPSGIHNPERLARLYFAFTQPDGRREVVSSGSFPDFLDLTDQSQSFSELAAYFLRPLTEGRGVAARPVQAALVSRDYFGVL